MFAYYISANKDYYYENISQWSHVICEQLFSLSYSTERTVTWCWPRGAVESHCMACLAARSRQFRVQLRTRVACWYMQVN